MTLDVTGIELTPGNNGKDCRGNGEHYDKKGRKIQICCDECDYLVCCTEKTDCNKCKDEYCPRKN